MSTANTRATKQAQGANADTWGTVANQQVFDVLDQGFGFLPLAITDADQSYTIPEGSISAAGNEARNLGLNVTGTLTANRTITLLPNTIAKVWVVKNSTAGGFNVILTNGSGATVTVAPAETVVVGGISGGGLATLLDTAVLSGGSSGVPTTRNVSTGAGLAGGGDLSADRTLTLDVASATAGTPNASVQIPYATGSLTRRAAVTEVLRYGMLGLPLEGTGSDVTEVYVNADGRPKRIAIEDFPLSGGGSSYADSDVEDYLVTTIGTTASQNQITHQIGVVNGNLTRIPVTSLPAFFGMPEATSVGSSFRFLMGTPDGSDSPRVISLANLANAIEPLIDVSIPSVLNVSTLTADDTIDIDSTESTLFRARDGGTTYLLVSTSGVTVTNLTATGSIDGDLAFGTTDVSMLSASSSGTTLGAENGHLTISFGGTTKRIKLYNVF